MVSRHGGLAIVGWYQLYPGSRIWNDRIQYGIDEGWELFDSLHLRSQAFRSRLTPRLSEEDIWEIDHQIDVHNLMRVLDSNDRKKEGIGDRSKDGGRDGGRDDLASAIYTPTDGYFLSKTGGFIDKTPPYFGPQAKLLSLDWT